MQTTKMKAMRSAGIACVIVLAIIGYWVFTSTSSEVIDSLTLVGKQVGGSTTYGVFILAICPPLAGFLAYFLTKWVLK